MTRRDYEYGGPGSGIGYFSGGVIRLAVVKKLRKTLASLVSDLCLYAQGVESSCLSRSFGPYGLPFSSLFFFLILFFFIQIRLPPLSFYSSVLSLQITIIGSVTTTEIIEFKDM